MPVGQAAGQGEAAREGSLKALAIVERLAQAEPDRADYQRDLSVSYNKLADLYRALAKLPLANMRLTVNLFDIMYMVGRKRA